MSRPTIACFLFVLACCVTTEQLRAADEGEAKPLPGQRIVMAGHSFHMFLPGIVHELAKEAGIEGHTLVATQGIGASRVIQHWDVADGKNQVKPALETGKVDVLTLSPIYLPDAGIENFARFAVEHNGNVRITLQEFWLPYDVYDVNYQKQRPAAVDRNARTVEELRKESAPYFASIDEHVATLNKQLGKPVLYVVPVGQAVIALREKIIAGQAPGLAKQDDLFSDAIGHATAPLQVLNAYCHFAVIYRRSPVGLPVPSALKGKVRGADEETTAKLNRLLQELAWEAVTSHPLSGVKK